MLGPSVSGPLKLNTLAHLAPVRQHPLGSQDAPAQVCERLGQLLQTLHLGGIAIAQSVQRVNIVDERFFCDLERSEICQPHHRPIVNLSPTLVNSARGKFAVLFHLTTVEVHFASEVLQRIDTGVRLW